MTSTPLPEQGEAMTQHTTSDELKVEIRDAVANPTIHPLLGEMRLTDTTGIYQTSEFTIIGDFSGAVTRLEALIKKHELDARIDELHNVGGVNDSYESIKHLKAESVKARIAELKAEREAL